VEGDDPKTRREKGRKKGEEDGGRKSTKLLSI
jgi:hypothetical protein